jgi:hypothetical protein
LPRWSITADIPNCSALRFIRWIWRAPMRTVSAACSRVIWRVIALVITSWRAMPRTFSMFMTEFLVSLSTARVISYWV